MRLFLIILSVAFFYCEKSFSFKCAADLREFVEGLPSQDLEVERAARILIGGTKGITISEGDLSEESIKLTREALLKKESFIYGGVFELLGKTIRVDALQYVAESDSWLLVNIRSGTKAKDVYLAETQDHFHFLRDWGLSMEGADLVFINPKAQVEKPKNWFTRQNVTEIVLGDDVVVAEEKFFWGGPRGRKAAKPEGVVGPGPHFNKPELLKRFQKLKGPLYYLDFETLGQGLPVFPKAKPYQNIPFQLSLIRQNKIEDSSPTFFEYLHPVGKDPRRAIAEFLIQYIPDDGGSILAYNAGFEKRAIADLAKLFPDLRAALEKLNERLEDPYEWVRATVFHEGFNGSNSLKVVAPTLLGQKWSYSDQVVNDGKFAQSVYRALQEFSSESPEAEFIRKALKEYCRQDTESLMELVKYLAKVVGYK